MARISRRFGPPALQEITAVPATIQGCSITRWFDDGEIFVAFSSVISNDSGAFVTYDWYLYIDDVYTAPHDTRISLPNTFFGSAAWSGIIPISEGMHTIDLRIVGAAAAGDLLRPNRSVLTVIQLPQYDFGEDII